MLDFYYQSISSKLERSPTWTPIISLVFTVSTTAQDSSDRFIYDSGTGDLFFDSDGNNSENQILIARLSNQASLSASDIIVN